MLGFKTEVAIADFYKNVTFESLSSQLIAKC